MLLGRKFKSMGAAVQKEKSFADAEGRLYGTCKSASSRDQSHQVGTDEVKASLK